MSNKVILCVDDDQDVINALRPVLESAGYAVLEAASAEEALATFNRQENVDLVIADLMMETIDAGIKLVKNLKLAVNNLPVVMLSSVGDDLNNNASYSELRLAGILQKPVKPEALLKLVAAKLG